MGEPTTTRAVIVDDEPAARDAIRTLLEGVEGVAVVGEAANGREAVERIRALRPELLFLDIQMPDRDGFEVLEALGDDVPPGVVFVTAHDEHAQRAFEVHALDYVVKPFGRPRFQAAVERALRRLEAEEALSLKETLQSLIQGIRLQGVDATSLVTPPGGYAKVAPRRLGVRMGSRTTLVDTAEIDWIEADGDLVKVHVGERVHLVSGRMRDFESLLADSGRFHRIHRSTIVNLDRVRVLDSDRDGGGSVVLSTGVQLRVARARWTEVEEALGLDLRG